MTKLYYSDPLAAAYMTKNFGVRLLRGLRTGKTIIIDYYTWPELVTSSSLFDTLESQVAYIHPDSLYIFKPQKGDCIIGIEEIPGIVTENNVDVIRMMKFPTIFRSGKPFFWPEEEV